MRVYKGKRLESPVGMPQKALSVTQGDPNNEESSAYTADIFYSAQSAEYDSNSYVIRKSAESIVLLNISSINVKEEGMNSILDPNYVVGFVDGEGCFSITVNMHHGRLSEVRLLFAIELEESDEEILERISLTIGCGKIYKIIYKSHPKWNVHCKLKVSNFKDINEKVIPFFIKYPLQAKKKMQFAKFCMVANLINKKKHLGDENVANVLRIRSQE